MNSIHNLKFNSWNNSGYEDGKLIEIVLMCNNENHSLLVPANIRGRLGHHEITVKVRETA